MVSTEGAAKARGLTMTGGQEADKTGQVSWAMFEWARTPFVILITIYIFAPYFAEHIVGDPVHGQAMWSYYNAIAGIFIALFAPVLGSIADRSGRCKPWLVFFIGIMAPSTFALWFVVPGGPFSLTMIGFIIVMATIAFELTSVFHNAMLPSIASPHRIGGLSGLGLALGNAGSLLILVLMLYGIALPGNLDWGFLPDNPWFGLDSSLHEPSRFSGPIVAVWVIIFSLPLLLLTPDRRSSRIRPLVAIESGIRSLVDTVRKLKQYKNVSMYLLARMLYNDGKTAILTVGGVYAAGTFHWGFVELLIYGIFLTIFAVFGGFFGGWLDDRFGSKKALYVSLGGTMLGLALSVSITPTELFFFIPYDPIISGPVWSFPYFQTLPEILFILIVVIIAICITAAYANSRTMLARIAPPTMMAEFFGLYALSGTATAFLGHGLVGLSTDFFNSQRAGFGSILILLAGGLVLFTFVREEQAVEAK